MSEKSGSSVTETGVSFTTESSGSESKLKSSEIEGSADASAAEADVFMSKSEKSGKSVSSWKSDPSLV